MKIAVKFIFLLFLINGTTGWSQSGSTGITYGAGINEDTRSVFNIDQIYYFEINDNLYLGAAAGASLVWYNGLGERSLESERFDVFLDPGVSARYYFSDLIKANLNLGYSFPITDNVYDVESDSSEITIVEQGGGVFTRLYLELDFNDFSIVTGPAFIFSSPAKFASYNVGIRFNSFLF